MYKHGDFYSVIFPGKGIYAIKIEGDDSDERKIRYSHIFQIQIVPAPGGTVSTITVPIGAICGQKESVGTLYLNKNSTLFINKIEENTALYADLIGTTSGLKIAQSINLQK